MLNSKRQSLRSTLRSRRFSMSAGVVSGRPRNRVPSGMEAMLWFRTRRDCRARLSARGAGRLGIKQALEKLVDPLTRGDPYSPLRWTCKSRAKLAAALSKAGWKVSTTTVGRLLHEHGYRRCRSDGCARAPAPPPDAGAPLPPRGGDTPPLGLWCLPAASPHRCGAAGTRNPGTRRRTPRARGRRSASARSSSSMTSCSANPARPLLRKRSRRRLRCPW